MKIQKMVLVVLFLFAGSSMRAAAGAANLGRELVGAAEAGNLAEVTRLLDAGAPINYESRGERTALMEASSEGRNDVVQLLLERGADITAIDKYNWVALYYAAQKGHQDIVEKLLMVYPRDSIFSHMKIAEGIARSDEHAELADYIHNFAVGEMQAQPSV